MLPDRAISTIKQEFAKRPEIVTAYLYGSQAKGYADSKSDIDLAIVTQDDFHPKDYRYQIELENVLHETLMGREVDVVHLNNTGLPLQYSVVTTGKRLYSKNDPAAADYEIRTIKNYEDMRSFYHKRLESNIKQAENNLERSNAHA